MFDCVSAPEGAQSRFWPARPGRSTAQPESPGPGVCDFPFFFVVKNAIFSGLEYHNIKMHASTSIQNLYTRVVLNQQRGKYYKKKKNIRNLDIKEAKRGKGDKNFLVFRLWRGYPRRCGWTERRSGLGGMGGRRGGTCIG